MLSITLKLMLVIGCYDCFIIQIVYTKKQHRESLLTTDAYRTAFDEQLNRNKKLVRQLAEVTATVMTNHSKTAKFKAAMKWLLQQLNEGT